MPENNAPYYRGRYSRRFKAYDLGSYDQDEIKAMKDGEPAPTRYPDPAPPQDPREFNNETYLRIAAHHAEIEDKVKYGDMTEQQKKTAIVIEQLRARQARRRAERKRPLD